MSTTIFAKARSGGGWADSSWAAFIWTGTLELASMARATPLRRLPTLDEVATVAAFMAPIRPGS